MFLFDEKRQQSDRRIRDDGPPAGCRERRSLGDRRQTIIAEISLQEWTRHFLKFRETIPSRPSQQYLADSAANAPAAKVKTTA